MAKISAGILLVRAHASGGPELLLAHPGGPFFARKDEGAWTIPKGAVEPGEEPFAAACRELAEETSLAVPTGPFVALGEIRQSGGKIVHAWAVRVGAEIEASALRSNEFEIEWPARSGRRQRFPELDRFAWLDPPTARRKILAAQVPFIDRAERWWLDPTSTHTP